MPETRPTVMVTGAGGAALPGLIRHLQGRGHRVVAGDMDRNAIGLFLADAAHVLPAGASAEFAPAIAAICRAEGVRVLIPLVDEELVAAKSLEGPELAVLAPRAAAADLFLDKFRLMAALSEAGIPVPQTGLLNDPDGSHAYPVIVKPRTGRGSRGVRRMDSAAEVAAFRAELHGDPADWLVQRCVEGTEYTVSVVAWSDGTAQAVVPKRIVDKRGITWCAVSERHAAIDALGRAVQERLRPDGPFNIQLRLDGRDGTPLPFEINPRYSTTLSLTIAAGVDEVGLLIDQAVAARPPAPVEDWRAGIMLRRHTCDSFLDADAAAARLDALGAGGPDVSDLLAGMVAAVEAVGARLLDLRATAGRQGHWDGTQFKSEADRIAHRDLSARLRDLAPDLPVVSEEDATGHHRARPARYWLIDPIDGTASLAGGFDGFVTQAALMEGGEPRLAAIRAPALDLTYAAGDGAGARMNNATLRVAPGRGMGVLIDNYPEPRGTAQLAFRELGFDGYVESGSIALKICRVADGTADLFFKDVVVRDWDIAAPHRVLREAGGHLALPDGRPYPYAGGYQKPGVIATPAAAHTAQVAAWLAGRTGDPRRTMP